MRKCSRAVRKPDPMMKVYEGWVVRGLAQEIRGEDGRCNIEGLGNVENRKCILIKANAQTKLSVVCPIVPYPM